ncbi:MAG TPA: peptide chain release factor-like protein [Patescibacteria group bacterium]|nr:peptide chain release factor-like protein [Patescibacteria group bacterium]
MNQDIAIIEIRGAAGGNEAKIWADDLLRMYLRFAEKQNWQIKTLGQRVLRIKGKNAYELLKKEAGVHRVQRIPTTERHGRIHTSTATVAILPEISENQIKINPQDLGWQFYRASTQGGQNVQKVSSAVRLIHKPSGIVVTCEQERFQEQNRKIALDLLRARLWEKEQAKKQNQLGDLRREAIGRGERSEKIRTYNFPQNRVTDHRLKKGFHNLEAILDGDLRKIIGGFKK